jgi:hypothetical protein
LKRTGKEGEVGKMSKKEKRFKDGRYLRAKRKERRRQ